VIRLTVNKPTSEIFCRLDREGFTLIELVIIIVALGILAAVAVPKFVDMTDSSREAATRRELVALRLAIVGNAEVTAAGTMVDRGFEGDVGFAPGRLQDLVQRPDSIAPYNKLTRLGWHGPYIDSSGSAYLFDAWGSSYAYDPVGRRIVSVGGGDTVAIVF
jgi:type II secretory pathway pseudopilin PulG